MPQVPNIDHAIVRLFEDAIVEAFTSHTDSIGLVTRSLVMAMHNQRIPFNRVVESYEYLNRDVK